MADDKKDKAAKDKAREKGGGGAPQKGGGDAPRSGAPKDKGAAPKEKTAKADGPKGGGKGGKGGKDQKGRHAEAAAGDEASEQPDPNYQPRLRLHYRTAVVAALIKKFSYKNPMMVPRLEKVVI